VGALTTEATNDRFRLYQMQQAILLRSSTQGRTPTVKLI